MPTIGKRKQIRGKGMKKKSNGKYWRNIMMEGYK